MSPHPAGLAAGRVTTDRRYRQLTSDLSAFIDAHPTEKPRTAADLDDAVGNSCPNDGAQALGVLGKSSFAEALGG